nr:flagellin [Methanosalsum zhilinae]
MVEWISEIDKDLNITFNNVQGITVDAWYTDGLDGGIQNLHEDEGGLIIPAGSHFECRFDRSTKNDSSDGHDLYEFYIGGKGPGHIKVDEKTAFGDITKLRVSVSLGPGSQDVDLSQLIIYLSDGARMTSVRYDHLDGGEYFHIPDGDYFSVSPIRIRDRSEFKATQPVLRTGDIMELVIDMRHVFQTQDPDYQGIEPRSQLSFQIRPEAGSVVPFEISTPGAYFDNRYILLMY